MVGICYREKPINNNYLTNQAASNLAFNKISCKITDLGRKNTEPDYSMKGLSTLTMPFKKAERLMKSWLCIQEFIKKKVTSSDPTTFSNIYM